MYENGIVDTIVTYWLAGRRTKQLPSGWITGNAPCCVDNRKRGGLIATENSVAFHCFNCKFKAIWLTGNLIDDNMKRFMYLLDMDSDLISKLRFMAFKLHEAPTTVFKHETTVRFNKCELPRDSMCINNMSTFPNKIVPVLEYMQKRQLFLDDHQFYWSPSLGFS